MRKATQRQSTSRSRWPGTSTTQRELIHAHRHIRSPKKSTSGTGLSLGCQDQADAEVLLGRHLPRAVAKGHGEGEVMDPPAPAVEPRGDRAAVAGRLDEADPAGPGPGEVDPAAGLVVAPAGLGAGEQAGE